MSNGKPTRTSREQALAYLAIVKQDRDEAIAQRDDANYAAKTARTALVECRAKRNRYEAALRSIVEREANAPTEGADWDDIAFWMADDAREALAGTEKE